MSRNVLIQVLTAIQNSPAFAGQDILTFSGFLSDDEVPEYVWTRFRDLGETDKRRVLGIARGLLR